MYRISYRFPVPGWSAKPLVSAHDRIVGTHRFAATPSGDRPVLVLTRDPVADRIDAVVVAALTRTRRGLSSELPLTVASDGVPSDCVVNFDTIHTLPRQTFRSPVATLEPARLEEACQTLKAATGC